MNRSTINIVISEVLGLQFIYFMNLCNSIV